MRKKRTTTTARKAGTRAKKAPAANKTQQAVTEEAVEVTVERAVESESFKSMNFFIPLKKIPTTTAQQKGERIVGGRIVHYDREGVSEAKELFLAHLLTRKPDAPAPKGVPLSVAIRFYFPENWDPEKEAGTAKGIRWRMKKPDCDNLVKIFLDCMTVAGYFQDDSQISALEVEKYDINVSFPEDEDGNKRISGIYVGISRLGS